jgi:hypothetical protein
MQNPMGTVFLVALVVLGGAAIAGAKGAKWKAINFGIILGFMAVGVGIGFLIGELGGNSAIGGHAAAPLMILLGCVGALGCFRRNKRRVATGN